LTETLILGKKTELRKFLQQPTLVRYIITYSLNGAESFLRS